MIVNVRDDGGRLVAAVAYDAPEGRRIPDRGTYAFLQTLDEGMWSTAYTLHDDEIVDGVPGDLNLGAFSGPGPDTYPLPDPGAGTYRICISFVVGHPASGATGCSAPFHTADR